MDNYQNIRETAQNIKVKPPKGSWSRIERKLDNTTPSKKSALPFSKVFFIAASLLLLIGSATFIYNESNSKVVVDKGHIVQWESLNTTIEGIYDLNSVRQLQAAYNR